MPDANRKNRLRYWQGTNAVMYGNRNLASEADYASPITLIVPATTLPLILVPQSELDSNTESELRVVSATAIG